MKLKIIDDFKEKWKEDREQDKEINVEVRKIQLEARKDRIIEVEKVKQEHRKKEEINAIKKGKPKGSLGGLSSAFSSFQDFATDFAKRQQPPRNIIVKRKIKRKKLRRNPKTVQKGKVIQIRL